MKQLEIIDFDKGYQFGRQEILHSLLNNGKYRAIKEGEFCITFDTLQSILKEEEGRYGQLK